MKTPGLIDLHLHLDGSLSVKSVKELAALQNIEIPENEEELLKLLRINDDCKDLTEYLEKFAFPGMLLQTKEAVALSVYNLQEELKEQGLIHAEIRFAPQLHTHKGLSQREVIEAAIEGLNRSDFSAGLILCCMRGNDNHEENLETVKLAKDYLGKGVVCVDIAGAEALFPTENFGDLFALARELEIPYTIHAGEADGPKSVWKALEFGTKRLGHGIRSLEDPELVEKIAREGITLELCPTSNIHTCMFPSIEEYPLRKLMEAGVKVTINTDNMTVSNINLAKEFGKLIAAFDLTDEEIKGFARNSVNACFASEETKKVLLEKDRRSGIMDNEKIYKMAFSKVFPLLLTKAVKKGRTEEEVFAVTNWLTGYPETDIRDFLNSDLTYGDFFRNAPAPNPNRKLITGKICGISVETIEEPLMQEIRYLDKLIDELSKGKSLDKILRK